MSLSAEKAILGAILIENSCMSQAVEKLVASDFSSQQNRIIYSAMCHLFETNAGIDLVTVRTELGLSVDVAYLASLTDGVPRLSNIESWIDALKEASTLRRLAQVATEVGQWCADANETSKEILDRAEQAIFAIADNRTKDGPLPISVGLKEALDGIEKIHEARGKISGLSSGIRELDEMPDGFRPGMRVSKSFTSLK